MRIALPLLVLAYGCGDLSSPKGTEEDTDGGDEGTPESADVVEVVGSSCATEPTPVARSLHQMAYFFVEEPVSAAGRLIQRGFVVHGGTAETGGTLGDLWLFDLTNLTTGACPWIELDDYTGYKRTGGTLVWQEAEERFMLAGGYEYLGDGDWQTSADRVAISLADAVSGGGSGWVIHGDLPAREYNAAEVGDHEATFEMEPFDSCGTTQLDVPCRTTLGSVIMGALTGEYCTEEDGQGYLDHAYVSGYATVDPCSPVATCYYTTSSGSHEEEWEVPFYEACAEDPQCTDDARDRPGDTASVAGLAEHGATYDPVTGITRWLSGTTGCEGSDCADWEPLFNLDTTGTQWLAAANQDSVIEFVGYDVELTEDEPASDPRPQPGDAAQALRNDGGGHRVPRRRSGVGSE